MLLWKYMILGDGIPLEDVGCYNIWANRRRLGCSELGEKSLWDRTLGHFQQIFINSQDQLTQVASCQAKAGWKEWCDWQPLRTHARGKGPSYPTWHSGHRCKRVHRTVWFPLEPAIQQKRTTIICWHFFFHKGQMDWSKNVIRYSTMTSSNGNIFRVSGPLLVESTGHGGFLSQRPVTRNWNDHLAFAYLYEFYHSRYTCHWHKDIYLINMHHKNIQVTKKHQFISPIIWETF